jgi:hypothetical protein
MPGSTVALAPDITPGKEPVMEFISPDGVSAHVGYSAINSIDYLSYGEPTYPPYLLGWLNIHENQYRAGREIVEYHDAGIRNVILVAQMQSGKTGTARYIVHHYLHCIPPPAMNPENIYFICGMNDNDLRMQAIREFQTLIPPQNILFSKQLQKINTWAASQPEDFPAMVRADLVIIDESHYAGNEHSHVDRFVKLVKAGGKQPLILSVSATPMAELATSELSCKGRVYLPPGPDYYGIEKIFSDGRIYPAADVSHQPERLMDIIMHNYEEQNELAEFKYNIIRLPSQWYYKDLQEELATLDMDIDYINHHTASSKDADFNNYLRTPPAKMTIIWVYNSLRAGKQLNTQHVGFVHDTASSAPDTIAQSLLGRIMGYGKRDHNVICYTDVPAARLMLGWVQKLFDPAWIPKGSRNIRNGYTDREYTWNNHPPICIALSQEARRVYRTLKKRHGNRYPYKSELIQAVIDSATTERSQLVTIFERYKPGRCGGVMIITEDNSLKTYRDFWAINYRCYINGTVTRGFDADVEEQDGCGCYYYVFVNLNICSSQYGLALIAYKERISGTRPAIHVTVTSKSRYAVP